MRDAYTMDPDDMDPDDFYKHVIRVSAITKVTLLVSARESILLYASCFKKVPQHTSILSSQGWVDELISGHDGQFYNNMGMHKHVYQELLSTLRKDTDLHDTRYISAEEQLTIFLQYAHWGLSNRALQERFQRSGDTIPK